ncbi:MAG: Arm DNA-binding domain-containing protein, partial [Planctomycetota bacterium]
MRFSKTTLLGLRPPTSSDRFYVYDDAAPGLALCVTARGVRTFYYVARVGDRPVRIKLGRLDALSVDDARRRAAELAGDVAKGRDPAAERR